MPQERGATLRRPLFTLLVLLLLAVPALADLDLSAISAQVDAQSAATTGAKHAVYVRLHRTLAAPDRPGLNDDFTKIYAVAKALAGPVSDDTVLFGDVSAALAKGLDAVFVQSTDFVQLTVALLAPKDRLRCNVFGLAGRDLSDRAAVARAASRQRRCAMLSKRAAAQYRQGIALATKLLDLQDHRQLKWSVPLHDLGGALLSIWAEPGLTPAVYAVGADDGAGPQFLRMGGEGWVRVPIAATGTLWWVTGAGDQVFADGTDGRIIRYDPATGNVTDLSIGVPVTLYGVWGSTANDVWAVGGNVDGTQPRTALYHYDGVSFTSFAQPPEANNRTLFKVWGTAANDVWVCGQAGLIMHFDGNAWSVQTSGTFESLFTIEGAAPTISVGGSVQPTIVESTPQGFVSVTLPSGTDTLRGVFVPPVGDAWACGLSNTILQRTNGHWVRVGGDPDASGRDFHAVFIDDAGGVYLAGGNLVTMNKGSLFYFGSRAIPTTVLPQAKLRARVQPVLYGNCALTACHIAPFVSENLDLSTAESTLAGTIGVPSDQSPLLRVLPGRPSQSYLVHKIVGTHLTVGGSGERMPQGGPYLSQDDVDAIRAWILEGARDN